MPPAAVGLAGSQSNVMHDALSTPFVHCAIRVTDPTDAVEGLLARSPWDVAATFRPGLSRPETTAFTTLRWRSELPGFQAPSGPPTQRAVYRPGQQEFGSWQCHRQLRPNRLRQARSTADPTPLEDPR